MRIARLILKPNFDIDVKSRDGRIPIIQSLPPEGHYEVINLYVDSSTGHLIVEYDDTPASGLIEE